MVVEQKILFENIWELFKNKEYFNAEKQLLAISTDNQSSDESVSYANYMIGCIHTTFDNKDKKQHIARDALLRCIESKYPIPMAYLMFSDMEEDKNVAVNYLKVALQQFPVSPTIYRGLLKHTLGSEKVKYIDEIDSKNIMDKQVLDTVIDFLIEEKNWAKAEGFLQKSLRLKDLSDEHKLYYTLLYAFSLVAQNKNIDIAKHDFKNLMQQDIANRLNYSHHMGYLWCLLIAESNDNESIIIFDKIPISSALQDFIYVPWYPINMNFIDIYKDIFAKLRILFAKDKKRKLKTDALEAYYLYTTTEIYDWHRYKKKHVKYLTQYLLEDKKNLEIACALFDMQVHFEQFFDAYCTLMHILGEYLDPRDKCFCKYDFYEECPESELIKIYDDITYKLLNNFYMDMRLFITYVFEPLIKFIFSSELKDKYKYISSLAKHIKLKYLLESDCKFEVAYSYVRLDPLSYDAEILYLQIMKEEPDNSSVLNNIGVLYEKKGNFYRAVDYLQKACEINKDEELFKHNFDRVRKIIHKYEKTLAAVKNENVWLLSKLNLISISANSQGEFSCRYQDRAQLLALSSPQKATEVFDKMLKNGYIEIISSGDANKANRYIINPLIKEYLATQSERLKRNEPYEEMANGLNYDNIIKLGYTQEVENAIDGITDLILREILKRDIREAAIALTTKQYKSCIVMCGSIIEAILTSKIMSKGYQRYDIGLLKKDKSNTKNVLEMDLNELLEIARKEHLIDTGEYHLSNFVRCYRNIIHPSAEIRKNYDANENNARTIWNALLLIINRII